MLIRPPSLVTAVLVLLAASFALPEPADARGRHRRNYAAEWEREEREERRREEREKARRDHLEHQAEMQKNWQNHSTDRQKRMIDHHERQLDSVLDHMEGKDRVAPPAPPAKSGTCIYGAGNKVLYQPDGVNCSRK